MELVLKNAIDFEAAILKALACQSPPPSHPPSDSDPPSSISTTKRDSPLRFSSICTTKESATTSTSTST
ncbi:hypothetical protein MKW98_029841 [Papaver atlanticum]|uniref:Uncharacterized protein n=1 Tax=Papaver atlanticum TaxID=357466 RepID=A0AAD4TJX4_9MAGN|nr:hypothetical protein MKW98_029841 [Papaver atlanticum]